MIGATFDEVSQYDDVSAELFQQQLQQQQHTAAIQRQQIKQAAHPIVSRCVHCLQRPLNPRCDNTRCARCCAQTGIHCSGHSGLSASNRVDRSALIGAHFAAFIEGSVPGGYRLTAQLGDRLFKGVVFTGPAAVRANVLVQTSNDGARIDKEGGVRLNDVPLFDAQQRALFHPDQQAKNIEHENAMQINQQRNQSSLQPTFAFQGPEESTTEYGELLVRRYRTLGIPLARLEHSGEYWRAMRVTETATQAPLPAAVLATTATSFVSSSEIVPRKRKPYVKSGKFSKKARKEDEQKDSSQNTASSAPTGQSNNQTGTWHEDGHDSDTSIE